MKNKMEFKAEQHPTDIAWRLANLSDMTDKDSMRDLEEVVYHLKACAENEYNAEYFRTFYRALERLVDL